MNSLSSLIERRRIGAESVHFLVIEDWQQGRNVCQVQAQARQGGQVAAVLLGVFGADRPSNLAPHHPPRPAPRHEADALPPPPPLPAAAPVFLQHFDMRWSEGAPPFTGGQGCHSRVHLRLAGDEAAALSTELQTVLLADLSPTPAIGHRPAHAAQRQQLGHLGAGAAPGRRPAGTGLVARRQRVADDRRRLRQPPQRAVGAGRPPRRLRQPGGGGVRLTEHRQIGRVSPWCRR